MPEALTTEAATTSGERKRSLVEFRDVSIKLGGRQILDHLSFEVFKGETFVIIGYSGTGKSVTLRNLVGLMRPDSGSIRVDGDEVTSMNQRELEKLRRRFGVLFQSGALIAWQTLFENVELPLLEHTRFSRRKRAEVVEEKLKLVNLWADRDKFPSEISGGMKKRAGLARAIALNPEIILYDEPSSGLDPVIAAEVDRLIIRLRDQLGMTSIVVTHDMDSAYRIADRIAMFYQGRMVQIGTPYEIQESANEEVQHFISGGRRRVSLRLLDAAAQALEKSALVDTRTMMREPAPKPEAQAARPAVAAPAPSVPAPKPAPTAPPPVVEEETFDEWFDDEESQAPEAGTASAPPVPRGATLVDIRRGAVAAEAAPEGMAPSTRFDLEDPAAFAKSQSVTPLSPRTIFLSRGDAPGFIDRPPTDEVPEPAATSDSGRWIIEEEDDEPTHVSVIDNSDTDLPPIELEPEPGSPARPGEPGKYAEPDELQPEAFLDDTKDKP